MSKFYRILLFILAANLLTACASYYQKLAAFNADFESGNLLKANDFLTKDKKGQSGKNELLFHLNKGTIEHLLGNYSESNNQFNQADIMVEDFQKKIGDQALAMVTNQMNVPYQGEDFEKVMIHYYKAINYLKLNDNENALIEARRLNLKLQSLNDKYKNKNKYHVDAFALNLIGLIYQADHDYNNAFIAYRNALEAYENSYSKQFNISVPLQLEKDLIYCAYKSGFPEEVSFYENKFQLKYESKNAENGDLLFFWNNGLGPVKSENSINFTKTGSNENYLTFVNQEYNLNFTVPYRSNKNKKEEEGFASLELIRVAFPKYIARTPYYESSNLTFEQTTQDLELAEDLNGIAFKTLADRMQREIGNALIRLATKKAAEYAMRDQNQNLGALVGVVNAVTEKADTRNWQTLPYQISYTRMSLPAGKQSVKWTGKAFKGGQNKEQLFTFEIGKGLTTFQLFQSLEVAKSVN